MGINALIRRDAATAPAGAVYYSSARIEMQRYVPMTARSILDVGCGEGRFLNGLPSRTEREYWGVELDARAAAEARLRLDYVLQGPVEHLLDQIPDHHFDCICLNDVLEHLVDPWTLLLELKKKLRSDGVIVTSIPNILHYKHLWRLIILGEWEYHKEGVLDRTHLRFFTRKSILRLFNDAGYEVLSLEGLRGSRKWKAIIWGLISFGKWSDFRYPQFAALVSIKNDTSR